MSESIPQGGMPQCGKCGNLSVLRDAGVCAPIPYYYCQTCKEEVFETKYEDSKGYDPQPPAFEGDDTPEINQQNSSKGKSTINIHNLVATTIGSMVQNAPNPITCKSELEDFIISIIPYDHVNTIFRNFGPQAPKDAFKATIEFKDFKPRYGINSSDVIHFFKDKLHERLPVHIIKPAIAFVAKDLNLKPADTGNLIINFDLWPAPKGQHLPVGSQNSTTGP